MKISNKTEQKQKVLYKHLTYFKNKNMEDTKTMP